MSVDSRKERLRVSLTAKVSVGALFYCLRITCHLKSSFMR